MKTEMLRRQYGGKTEISKQYYLFLSSMLKKNKLYYEKSIFFLLFSCEFSPKEPILSLCIFLFSLRFASVHPPLLLVVSSVLPPLIIHVPFLFCLESVAIETHHSFAVLCRSSQLPSERLVDLFVVQCPYPSRIN